MATALLDIATVSDLWNGQLLDRTGHSPGAQHRPAHDAGCQAVVLHRIGEAQSPLSPEDAATLPPEERLGSEGGDVEGIIHFFTAHPEGVATVTLDGTYDSKRSTIEKWKSEGVPADMSSRAFVPYTFLIAPDGTIHQMLPLHACGAHARGFNQSGYGVAFIGDFRFEGLTDAQVEAGVAVCIALLRQLELSPKHVKLLGHDEARAAIGQGPKECPGKHFPLDTMKQRIRAAFG